MSLLAPNRILYTYICSRIETILITNRLSDFSSKNTNFACSYSSNMSIFSFSHCKLNISGFQTVTKRGHLKTSPWLWETRKLGSHLINQSRKIIVSCSPNVVYYHFKPNLRKLLQKISLAILTRCK